MTTGSLAVNGQVVADLRRMLHSGQMNLATVPGLVKEIIRHEMWRERIEPTTGEIVPFPNFAAFITTPPLEGLGADVPTLLRLCGDDREALDLLDRATANAVGTNQHDNNIIDHAPQGTSKQRALRTLRDRDPALHARVLAGELSPHAAMVEAGFRKPTMTVPANVEALARVLRRRLSGDDLAELLRLLTEEGDA